MGESHDPPAMHIIPPFRNELNGLGSLQDQIVV
jgi:hypothetical protein